MQLHQMHKVSMSFKALEVPVLQMLSFALGSIILHAAAPSSCECSLLPLLTTLWFVAAGRPAVSVQWGAWHGVGMVATSEAVLSRMRRSGVSTVSPPTGLAALGAVLHSTGPTQVLPLVFVETSPPLHHLQS